MGGGTKRQFDRALATPCHPRTARAPSAAPGAAAVATAYGSGRISSTAQVKITLPVTGVHVGILKLVPVHRPREPRVPRRAPNLTPLRQATELASARAAISPRGSGFGTQLGRRWTFSRSAADCCCVRCATSPPVGPPPWSRAAADTDSNLRCRRRAASPVDQSGMSEKGVRLAQKMKVGACTPVGA